MKSKSASTSKSTKSEPEEDRRRRKTRKTVKTSVNADSKLRKKIVAISNFHNAVFGNNEPQIGRQLIALFESEFTKNGNFQVTATQQIQEILKSQDISFDERMDPATAAKIGKVASANLFVFGNITEFNLTEESLESSRLGDRTTHTAKLALTVTLVDVNTGLALKSVKIDEIAESSSNRVKIPVFGSLGKKQSMNSELRNKLFHGSRKQSSQKCRRAVNSVNH